MTGKMGNFVELAIGNLFILECPRLEIGDGLYLLLQVIELFLSVIALRVRNSV